MIATAVEEQSATTNEMSRNVGEAAKGAGEISNNIAGVAEAAQSTSNSVAEAQKATEHLAQMSEQLRQLVGQFKVSAENSKGYAMPPRLWPRARPPARTRQESDGCSITRGGLEATATLPLRVRRTSQG